jgi:hypothetical protein
LECAGTTALCQAVSSNARTVAREKAATRRRTPEMSPELSVSKMNAFRPTPSLNVLQKRLIPKKPCFIVSAFCRILKAESIIHFLSRM